MKHIPSFLLVALLITAVAIPPTEAFAKRGSDDSHQEDRTDDNGRHGRHHDSLDDDSSSDDTRSDSTSGILEVEADVFTDITIVKVELPSGKKVVFETSADTEAEVVDAIVAKLNLSKTEVEAVLDFEIEDRASRTKERAKISNQANSTPRDAQLKEQIAKLQELIELLLAKLAQQNV
jgi:hypothetical protein